MVKDLETSHLDVRSVMFMTGGFRSSIVGVCIYGLLRVGVQVINHDRLGSAFRQDDYSIEQNEKCV